MEVIPRILKLSKQSSFQNNMRPQIEELIKFGVLPSEKNSDVNKIRFFQEALAAIQPPVTDQEAGEPVKLFGDDSCFGLAWTLLHIIETAPGWPINKYLPDGDTNPWIIRLRKRAKIE